MKDEEEADDNSQHRRSETDSTDGQKLTPQLWDLVKDTSHLVTLFES